MTEIQMYSYRNYNSKIGIEARQAGPKLHFNSGGGTNILVFGVAIIPSLLQLKRYLQSSAGN